MTRRFIILSVLLTFFGLSAAAQFITGTVIDAETGEGIPYASVVYKGHNVAVISDEDGHYRIDRHNGWNITYSAVGYKTQVVEIDYDTRNRMDIKLSPDGGQVAEVTVKSKRVRYSRKNNPAVDLMRKVIEKKKETDLANHDYYRYEKYEKLTLAANDLTPAMLEKKPFSSTPWLLEQVEVCKYNLKMILPLSVDETASEIVYRKSPQSKKTYIKGQQSSGINDLFQTGDILNIVMKDVFTDVDLYDDQIRLLQYPFTSPIGKDAIAFYRFYIVDTVAVARQGLEVADSCIHLHFLPNNQMDFGFRGDIYILKDSSYHVRRCELTLPKQSSVNFVKNMRIEQEFEQLSNGEWVLTQDDAITELSFAKFLQEAIVIRTTRYSDYSFRELPKRLFKGARTEIREPDAGMQSKQFWNKYRQVELTKSEESMGGFVENIQKIKGFKYIMYGLNALIENSIETGDPNKIDIAPVNTILSRNQIDGWRSRLSLKTTANLNKRFFAEGYYGHGWGSHKNYYNGALTYSFIDKVYMPWEYPKRTLKLESTYDISSPSDRYLPTDKDNFLVAFKWAGINKMTINNRQKLSFEYEMYGGLRTTVSLKAEEYEACGAMSFQTLDKPRIDYDGLKPNHEFMRTTELFAELRFAPSETYINSKQRRVTINHDAPSMSVSHTFGFKNVLGGQYNSNFTEAKLYQRFWLNSWGKVDLHLKAGIQWNKVPYMLLIHPAANQSFVIEEEMFNLINNMEFLNDRYLSGMLSWDMNGKFFNRVPLLKKLKWREYFAVNMLWGDLSDKNNPDKNPGDPMLMYFPEGCHVMNPKVPYFEVIAGVHNIFKIFHVEYVRRLNYLSLPTSERWGIRYIFRLTF
ncbi:MAG: carboxypeptidase-like regulatory domain-containing protein [Prevotella sp.]|nr:carboxypeptidase-like regulatory domain-containing protein [Prevotella sp.]